MTLLLLAGGAVVYATGGTQHAFVHLLYVPVLLASCVFGPLGAVAVGVVAGVVVGPLMPLNVAEGVPQETLNWLYRLGFFALIGGVSGGLNHLLRRQLRETERTKRCFASMMHHAADIIVACDEKAVVCYASPSMTALIGLAVEDVVGTPLASWVHPDDRAALEGVLGVAPGAAAPAPAEMRVRHADGSWRHLEGAVTNLLADPDVGAVVLNARDVTARRAMENELRHRAWHDPDTGLPNRQRFAEQLEEAVGDAAPGRWDVAVLLVNLDRFESINEIYGPDTGEQLITALAHRLAGRIRPGDVLARYSGHEFALLCRDVRSVQTAVDIVERLLDAVREPFLLVTGEVYLTASVGLALANDADGDAARLTRDAFAAVRRAKEDGGSRYAVFEPCWRAEAAAALQTENALHGALERNEFELHYQPVIELATGRPVAVEALIRWQHPRLGVVSPADFIPIAEQTGMIVPIGRWVLQQACAQLAAWRRQLDLPDLYVAVNLSARQLDAPELLDDVRTALAESGLPARALTLELTETALLGNLDLTAEALHAIKSLGVRLAIDDFGTGYSSLGYLKHLPVDILKIDRMFTNQLGTSHDDAIVGAIVGMARILGLDTIAEGVETAEQARRLRELGCNHSQGYHHARPQPAHNIAGVLGALPAAAQ